MSNLLMKDIVPVPQENQFQEFIHGTEGYYDDGNGNAIWMCTSQELEQWWATVHPDPKPYPTTPHR
jgi:hypothetical protein